MTAEDYDQFPLRDFLGMDVEETGIGTAVARADITDDLLNPNRVAHGGVIFTLADTAMGKATMSVLAARQFCASVEIHMRFLQSASAGQLEARATVIRAGRRIVHLRCDVFGDDETLVATASGTFAVVSGPESPDPPRQ